MANTGQRDIVDVAPVARKEASVFHPPDRLPDSEFDHFPKSLRFARLHPSGGMFVTFHDLSMQGVLSAA